MADESLSNETPDMQIDSTLIKLAEQYASCDRRSADINEERATIRENAEKLGIPSKSFQHAVGMTKHMSKGERRDYQVGVNRVLKAIGDRQGELYPAEFERANKRDEAKKAENKPKTKAEKDARSDANPKSDPKRGGTGNAKPALAVVPPSGDSTDGDQLIKDVAARKEAERLEQEAGANALDAGLPETKKSQSQQSAEKLEAAKLN